MSAGSIVIEGRISPDLASSEVAAASMSSNRMSSTANSIMAEGVCLCCSLCLPFSKFNTSLSPSPFPNCRSSLSLSQFVGLGNFFPFIPIRGAAFARETFSFSFLPTVRLSFLLQELIFLHFRVVIAGSFKFRSFALSLSLRRRASRVMN